MNMNELKSKIKESELKIKIEIDLDQSEKNILYLDIDIYDDNILIELVSKIDMNDKNDISLLEEYSIYYKTNIEEIFGDNKYISIIEYINFESDLIYIEHIKNRIY